MRVFVTGASGHIGSALVPELLSAGHEVVGLARSDAAARKLAAAGAGVRRGDLDDGDTLRAAASAADGVIHLGFRHDLMQAGDMSRAAATDLDAINALAGVGKPFVGTSGTLLLAMVNPGEVGTEADVGTSGYRIDAENLVIGLAEGGLRSSVVRLPPVVHSERDRHGFVPNLIAIARRRGFAAYVGDGAQRWPAVHTLDAARLYRLALESAPGGSRLHGVADEGVTLRLIAETIARSLECPVRPLSPEDAADYFGFLAPLVQMDNPTSSVRTRETVGWRPEHPGLLADLDEGHYFDTTA